MRKVISTKVANELIFVVTMWLLSRLVIVAAMQFVAPLLPFSPMEYEAPPVDFVPGVIPKMGWELFAHWDGAWYRRIATAGYEYANDGQQHTVAFFPLFPLVTRGVMTLGLPFAVAATLVNNLAFLGAMLVLYFWVKERHGINAAKWVTAVLAWCPLSLYGTVIYTEGLFLLLTTAALRAFDHRQHAWAALWGAMATATRATGITIVPAFLFVAWRERRPTKAYVAGLASAGGLFLYIVYCAINFGDPLAFAHVQKAWWQPTWINIFQELLVFDIASFIKIIMIFGGGYLLWCMRHELSRVIVVYGFCSLAMIITAGALSSLSRYSYGIVSIPLAFGVLLSRHPRWGYATVGLFIVMLAAFAIRFAWWRWVA